VLAIRTPRPLVYAQEFAKWTVCPLAAEQSTQIGTVESSF
jgi:hypothetical protein